MLSRVTAQETSRLLRAERTADLAARLKAGDFDAARYESTPRARAEVLAAVLSKALSRGAMRRRLKRLGVTAEFCGGDLLAISVEGGGLDVRGRNGRGQVVTGAGLDERLLNVFPELLPFTLRNLTLNIPFGASFVPAVDVALPAPPTKTSWSASGVEAWNLSIFLKSYLASQAKAWYTFDLFRNLIPTHPYGLYSAQFAFTYLTVSIPWDGSVYPTIPIYSNSNVIWPADGLNWCETHAEQADAVLGSITASATTTPMGAPQQQFRMTATAVDLHITYTVPPCETCDLTIQANSACDAAAVGGGVFSLDVEGYECTQDGSGVCTITGIPDGTYEWTWTKTGYLSLFGTFTCDCAGGASELVLEVTPDGGCPDIQASCRPLSIGPVRDLSLLIMQNTCGGGLAYGPLKDLALLVERPHS